MNAMEQLVSLLKKEKKTGSDYIGTVTKVKGNTALVKFEGSDIADTPVSLTIGAKEGDKVRVRVSGGKAWITGNDTEPPTNDGSKIQIAQESTSKTINNVVKGLDNSISTVKQTADEIALSVEGLADDVDGKMAKDMSNRSSSITIDSGKMEFKSNTIVIDSSKFKLDSSGDATFSGALSAATGSFAGSLSAATGSFAGSLSAASGSFKGSLSAATGSFKGAVSFDWGSGSNLQKVYLGDSSRSSPFNMVWSNANVETEIQSGDVSVYYGSSTYCQMTPSGVIQGSDRRLKEDIEDIDADAAKQLRPVKYSFKNDPDGKVHYGFIAQEVQDILPDTVTRRDQDGYLGLNYQELIAPLYALVQQQEERIMALEDEVRELKEKIDG